MYKGLNLKADHDVYIFEQLCKIPFAKEVDREHDSEVKTTELKPRRIPTKA